MGEDLPCITLVKMQEIAERPVLTPDEQALEQALSMLCSFLSLEDFISFLQSDKFARLARTESPWIVFEIGLYIDHTKTLQLIPSSERLTLADAAMTGAFVEHVWHGAPDSTMTEALHRWMGVAQSDLQ